MDFYKTYTAIDFFFVFVNFLFLILGSFILSAKGLSFFKKRKFRKFIRECGILQEIGNLNSYYFRIYNFIREGLHDWEQTILKEELERVGEEKEKREIEESRKKFFEKW
tara:strand:- start:387 stop:713 length:327 start_codon:yes stop_codon:yes gene_type:complete